MTAWDKAITFLSYTPFAAADSPLFIPTISISVVFAYWHWRQQRQLTSSTSSGFWRYLVPPHAQTSPSTTQDIWLALFTPPVVALIFFLSMSASVELAHYVHAGAEALFGRTDYHPAAHPILANIGYTILIALVVDLIFFLFHVACHENRMLWELHKVHHSATVLTPLTDFRSHPLQLIINTILTPTVIAFVAGAMAYLTHGTLSEISYLGVNVILFATHIPAGTLRHSHIPASFGLFDYILQSPAMHQVHHSSDPRHHGKNYSGGLACWDLLWGSFYRPEPGEKFTPGLGEIENRATEQATVRELMLDPLRNIAAIILEPRRISSGANTEEAPQQQTQLGNANLDAHRAPVTEPISMEI